MTGQIFDKVLTTLNHRLSTRLQSILLLMDNAGCHPPEYKEKYSNIQVILPPNTTSKVQPLDLGIIQNFKVYYRQLLLCYVLAKIDSCTSASDVIKSDVNILTAIRWIACAWDKLKPETISKCFRKAGLSVVARAGDEDDDPSKTLMQTNSCRTSLPRHYLPKTNVL